VKLQFKSEMNYTNGEMKREKNMKFSKHVRYPKVGCLIRCAMSTALAVQWAGCQSQL